MKVKAFIRNILPLGERLGDDGQTYQWQDIVICWRETEESGYIQDHTLKVRLRGKSLDLYQSLGYQLNDQIELLIVFNSNQNNTSGVWYNTVTGLIEQEKVEQVNS